eukprot:2196878-Rhodomonas_salina.1
MVLHGDRTGMRCLAMLWPPLGTVGDSETSSGSPAEASCSSGGKVPLNSAPHQAASQTSWWRTLSMGVHCWDLWRRTVGVGGEAVPGGGSEPSQLACGVRMFTLVRPCPLLLQ